MKKEEKKFNREVNETATEKETAKSPEGLGEIQDGKEIIPDKEIISEKELREKIEGMDVGGGLKMQAQNQAQQLKSLKEEEKVKNLLKIAKDKGVIYAVNVAKKMDDPYVLDRLHDVLTEKGFYKKFKI